MKQLKINTGIARREVLKRLGVFGLLAGMGGSALGMNTKKTSLERKEIDVLVDFADTDYTESIMKNCRVFSGLNADLLMRSYTYIDNQNRIARTFNKVHASDQRSAVLAQSKLVLTPCEKTATEAISKGANVVYLFEKNLTHNEQQHFSTLNITTAPVNSASKIKAAINAVNKV